MQISMQLHATHPIFADGCQAIEHLLEQPLHLPLGAVLGGLCNRALLRQV